METGDRADVVARLARLSALGAGGRHLADRLCEASRAILGADGAWLTVQDSSGQSLRVSSTDPVAATLEDVQDVVGEGPCRDAYRDDTPVTADVGGEPDGRWIEFSRWAWQRIGRATVRAYPMRLGAAGPFGVLSFYARPGSGWAEPDEVAQLLADVVGVALLRGPVPKLQDQGGAGLGSAGAEVYQATGMVTAQLDIPPDDALALLRAHAYAHDATLTEVADQVVKRRLNFQGDS